MQNKKYNIKTCIIKVMVSKHILSCVEVSALFWVCLVLPGMLQLPELSVLVADWFVVVVSMMLQVATLFVVLTSLLLHLYEVILPGMLLEPSQLQVLVMIELGQVCVWWPSSLDMSHFFLQAICCYVCHMFFILLQLPSFKFSFLFQSSKYNSFRWRQNIMKFCNIPQLVTIGRVYD